MFKEQSCNELIRRVSCLDAVEGVMLSGSVATQTDDEFSDYDFYIYSSGDIDAELRRKTFSGLFSYIEIDNRFWETEDDGVLIEGRAVEIIYRDITWMERMLSDKIEQYHAETGYTTCFWNNLLSSKILFDRTGNLSLLKKRFSVPYPEPLRAAIIAKNYPLLRVQIPAYYHQIQKALCRKDIISVNHRIAAFIASYADILFALNRVSHPGEKKLLHYLGQCNCVPVSMDSDIRQLISAGSSMCDSVLLILDTMINRLDDVLRREGFVFNVSVLDTL